MNWDDLILGLVDNRSAIGNPDLAEKCRDLTLTWSRYCYHGPVLEHSSVDWLVDTATSKGAHYCLLLAYGQILLEQWLPDAREPESILPEPRDQTKDQFLVAGRILEEKGGWYGIDYRCLLVNLKLFSDLGRPFFQAPGADSVKLPGVLRQLKGDKIDRLEPGPGIIQGRPMLPGWRLIAESLSRGLAVSTIEGILGKNVLDLAPENKISATHLAEHLNGGMGQPGCASPDPRLSTDQITFLDSIFEQTENAKRGVFLLNIEPYTDVDQPPGTSWTPISTLYSVSAGFKPNRILQTHGINEKTRVVFFDYSPNALEVRKALLNEWNGDDFPRFVRYIFQRFPYPETYYQLWAGQTPDDLDWDDLDTLWQRELERFGGAREFKSHWMKYRALQHEFIHVDIFNAPMQLLDRISTGNNAVMWFSNAPFTVYSNWSYTLDERKRLYEDFIGQLAERNPDMLLYGADYTNTSINCITAGEYWKRYRDIEHDSLCPQPLNRYQIRS